MTNFSKMVAIPIEEYEQLQSTQLISDPLERRMAQYDREYHQHEKIQQPDIQQKQQSNTFHHMLNLAQQIKDRTLAATPSNYRRRAQNLIDFISPLIKWNEKGEILSSFGGAIPGSQIEDLVQYAVRDKRRGNIIPVGWDYFLQKLKELNVPKMSLGVDTIAELDNLPSPTDPVIFPIQLPKRRRSDSTGAPSRPKKRRRESVGAPSRKSLRVAQRQSLASGRELANLQSGRGKFRKNLTKRHKPLSKQIIILDWAR